MTLMRYQPWSILNQLHNELGKAFDVGSDVEGIGTHSHSLSTAQWIPACDVKEDAERYTFLVDVPGVDAKNIEISLDQNVLTIKGERKFEKKDEKNGYCRIERQEGVFFRQFTLPATVDAQGIKAKNKHGVLEVIVPKTEKARSRTIPVITEE